VAHRCCNANQDKRPSWPEILELLQDLEETLPGKEYDNRIFAPPTVFPPLDNPSTNSGSGGGGFEDLLFPGIPGFPGTGASAEVQRRRYWN